MNQPSQYVINQKGEAGGVYINDTVAHPGNFDGFLAVTACVIAAMTSAKLTGPLAGMNVPAGVKLNAPFSSITLTSGTGIAYNRIP